MTTIHVSEAQYAVLAILPLLEIDIMIETPCANGYTHRANSNVTVCVSAPSAASDAASAPQNSPSISMIVVGLMVGALVVVAVLWYRRTRRRGSSVYTKHTNEGASTTPSFRTDPELQAHRIEYAAVECLEKPKSPGTHGITDVWYGRYIGQDFAVQRLRSDQKAYENVVAFAAAAVIVARHEHPRIARFVGVAWTRALGSIEIVTAWMDGGTLASLLSSSQTPFLTWANPKLQIAIDVAEALGVGIYSEHI